MKPALCVVITAPSRSWGSTWKSIAKNSKANNYKNKQQSDNLEALGYVTVVYFLAQVAFYIAMG